MVEFDITKQLEATHNAPIVRSAFTGGDRLDDQLLTHLAQAIAQAKAVDIMVSFLMESGVKLLEPILRNARSRGVKFRILTGCYLGITQPSALYLIKSILGRDCNLKIYGDQSRSFHPKTYFVHYENFSEVFIGSSNLSKSALTRGVEWNYRFSSLNDVPGYNKFWQNFNELYNHFAVDADDPTLRHYAKFWRQPQVLQRLEEFESSAMPQEAQAGVVELFSPRGAQIDALYALENARLEGAQRGLVIAATGVGKTALAAFDSLSFKRILFVAHREEILNQSAKTFSAIRHSRNIGFFNAQQKCLDKTVEVLLASVATLGSSRYLNEQYFAPDHFDYVVVDEIHHGVARQYASILNYFKPKFMLGLTATPERMDGKNIFQAFDYNVPFEIDLYEAINRGMLVPFRYYGIYDDTDYSKLHIRQGHYDSQELTQVYLENAHRNRLILGSFNKYGSRRALGFCCSKSHAEQMARVFCQQGIEAVAVYSNADGDFSENRKRAVEKLMAGQIRVIFAVDMFNEGVDITSLDLVMFLRPTESPVIFLQQLGRGLRKSTSKDHLNVLDFIGNYEKAGRIVGFLNGKNQAGAPDTKSTSPLCSPQELDLPQGCMVDFDLKLLDLFAQMSKKQQRLHQRIIEEYRRIREELDRVPTRMELFIKMDDLLYRHIITHSKENIFKNYLGFLQEQNELSNSQIQIAGSFAGQFIRMLENTAMSRVYKMPVLKSFIGSDHSIKTQVTAQQMLSAWKIFFAKDCNWRDLDPTISHEKFLQYSDKWHLDKIFRMPVHFLLKSSCEFFSLQDQSVFCLNPALNCYVSDDFFAQQFVDVVEYRAVEYFKRRYELNRQNE